MIWLLDTNIFIPALNGRPGIRTRINEAAASGEGGHQRARPSLSPKERTRPYAASVRRLSVELGQHLLQAVIRPAASLAFFQRRAQRYQLGLVFALA